jgi:arginyl-tRNA synthetase
MTDTLKILRASLPRAAKTVLKNGLTVLGIDAPRQM